VGVSLASSPEAATALEALGLLAAGGEPEDIEAARTDPTRVRPIRFLLSSAAEIGDFRWEVIVSPQRETSSDIELAAVERARRIVQAEGPQTDIHVLVAAGGLRGARRSRLEGVSVIAPDSHADDLVSDTDQVAIDIRYAEDLLQAA
jgi:hypothetical protein